MRHIKVPEDIALANPETGTRLREPSKEDATIMVDVAPTTFHQFVMRNLVSNNDVFGQGYASVLAAFKVDAAFRDADPGDVVDLEDDVHEKLCDALNRAEWRIPAIAMQYMAFMAAIVDAPSMRLSKVAAS